MTIIRMTKKCRKCGRRFSYNPSAGRIICPRCKAIN